MAVGISSASFFANMTTEDAILRFGEQGVPVCELFLNSFCEYEQSFIDLLEERKNKSGITVNSVHPMGLQFEPQLFSGHPRQKADATALFRRICAAARQLGAKYYIMHGPAYLNGAARGLSPQRVAPKLKDYCSIAEEYGITLTLENVSWCLFNTPETGLRLRELTDDRLRYTLDIKQAVRSGYSPLEYIEAVGEKICNVHLCDHVLQSDGSYRWMLPTRGCTDLRALKAALDGKGYAGHYLIEVYSDTYASIDDLFDCWRETAALLD